MIQIQKYQNRPSLVFPNDTINKRKKKKIACPHIFKDRHIMLTIPYLSLNNKNSLSQPISVLKCGFFFHICIQNIKEWLTA